MVGCPFLHSQEARNGELSEWPKEHDWKSCIRQKRIESSNLSLSANRSRRKAAFFFSFARQYPFVRAERPLLYGHLPAAAFQVPGAFFRDELHSMETL